MVAAHWSELSLRRVAELKAVTATMGVLARLSRVFTEILTRRGLSVMRHPAAAEGRRTAQGGLDSTSTARPTGRTAGFRTGCRRAGDGLAGRPRRETPESGLARSARTPVKRTSSSVGGIGTPLLSRIRRLPVIGEI